MHTTTPPILYSFRRCPYAIRARLALHDSGIEYELREVRLRDKPAAMLSASPKGSVPILVTPDGQVIDESWDIMQWALKQHDPDNWLGRDGRHLEQALALVEINDSSFKTALDRYKYADRHPEHTQAHYRTQGEAFLQQLDARLQSSHFLLGDNSLSIADAAILPFVRQFAGVDQEWFAQSPYPRLREWMDALVGSSLFSDVMQKHPVWREEGQPRVIQPQRPPS